VGGLDVRGRFVKVVQVEACVNLDKLYEYPAQPRRTTATIGEKARKSGEVNSYAKTATTCALGIVTRMG
jgi:hypothetical protein